MPKMLLRVLLVALFFAYVVAAPLQRQETPPDVEPDAELLPSGPTPSPSVSPIPPSVNPVAPVPPIASPGTSPDSSPGASPAAAASPGVSPGTSPGASPGASPAVSVAPGASPVVSPPTGERPLPPGVIPGDTDGDGVQDDFDGDGEPDETDEPVATPDVEGGDSNRAALAGGLTGGIFGLILLALCIFCVFGRKKREPSGEPTGTGTGTGVYTSTDAGVASVERDATGTGGVLETDDARGAGPAVDADAGAGIGAAGLGAAGLGAAGLGAAGMTAGVVAAVPSEEESIEAVPRGPTPPPHDYVLGAGPAETRAAFVDLRTKFERDEIGDNSAVLGVERDGVVGEGLEMDISGEAVEQGAAVTAGVAGAAAAGSTALAQETRKVPDRGEVPVTFESQERLMAGGDGSGAISDAAMSLTAASIAEESGDVPSLERDPIRERDETF